VELSVFDGQKRNELSMIEVAFAILDHKKDVMDFNELVNELQNYLGKSDLEIRETLSQFYTDLNTDGKFISLGDNRWGLRSWYAIDEVDEEIAHVEDDEEENRPKKKKKRINAFATSEDDDMIDYNDDDPEDDSDPVEDDLTYDDDDDDDEDETVAYDSDLQEIAVEDLDDDLDEEIEEVDEFADDEDDDDFVDEDEEIEDEE